MDTAGYFWRLAGLACSYLSVAPDSMNPLPAQEPIETPNLTLVPADPALAGQVLALHQRNRQHFSLGSPAHVLDRQDIAFWQQKLKQEQDGWHQGSRYCFYGMKEHQLICQVQVSELVRGVFQAAYLGYKIDEQFQGLGLMREAVTAVIQFAFADLRLHRLMANYQPHNERSGQLLKRMGFRQEGIAEKYLYINGAWRDHVLTSLTNDQFDASPLEP